MQAVWAVCMYKVFNLWHTYGTVSVACHLLLCGSICESISNRHMCLTHAIFIQSRKQRKHALCNTTALVMSDFMRRKAQGCKWKNFNAFICVSLGTLFFLINKYNASLPQPKLWIYDCFCCAAAQSHWSSTTIFRSSHKELKALRITLPWESRPPIFKVYCTFRKRKARC